MKQTYWRYVLLVIVVIIIATSFDIYNSYIKSKAVNQSAVAVTTQQTANHTTTI